MRRSQGTCTCMYGFYGSDCSKKCEDKANCHAHGTCVEDGECWQAEGRLGKCLCDEGWVGDTCNKEDTSMSKKAAQLLVSLTCLLLLILQLYLWNRQKVAACSLSHP